MSADVPDREAVISHTQEVLQATSFFISRAILFGSVARGTHDEHSDADVLLASPDFEGMTGARRGQPFRDNWSYTMFGAVDVLCYTPAEYRDIRANRESLIQTAEQEGIVLVDQATELPAVTHHR